MYSSEQTQVQAQPMEDHSSLATYQEEEEGYEDYSQYQDESQIGLGNNGDQNTPYDKGKNDL